MKKKSMFDVIVVGGNLAGASAAINAASRGVSVALVERNKEPFNPAHCGEAIDEITLEIFDLNNLNFAKNKIRKLNIGPKQYILEFKKSVFVIFDRNYVEKELLKRAEQQGAKLILGISMKDFKAPHDIILTNDEIIKGKIIIDGSGIACQVGRRIGMDTKLRPEDIGVCIQSRVKGDFDADTMKFWFHKPYAPLGYAWLFPLNTQLANIGIISIIGGQPLDYGKLLKNYIKYECSGKYEILKTFRSCVPLSAPMNKLIKDNVMITGDAARLANSALGGGIRNALFSGGIAGIIAGKYIRKEIQSLEPYQNILQKNIVSLRKFYNKKIKIDNEKKFVRAYNRAFAIICISNKLAPNFLYNLISNLLKKDGLLLDSLK